MRGAGSSEPREREQHRGSHVSSSGGRRGRARTRSAGGFARRGRHRPSGVANAVTLQIADQDGQGSGTFTATYADGHETTSGTSKPPFSDPSGQKNLTGGVLAQEATAKPGFSAACAGLAGDGGSVLNLGNSSCLTPGNLLTGSFGSLDPST